ncbi:MAG TPA: translocation/assembly module TamB domain-containing protein, partial [Allocoleopsis sp.]
EDLLHLEEFNIFPVGIIEDGQVQSQELAFEASKNITNDLTLSVLNVVTSQEPVEVILRYRLNNNIRFRGFTNIVNDTGILIQFNAEF